MAATAPTLALALYIPGWNMSQPPRFVPVTAGLADGWAFSQSAGHALKGDYERVARLTGGRVQVVTRATASGSQGWTLTSQPATPTIPTVGLPTPFIAACVVEITGTATLTMQVEWLTDALVSIASDTVLTVNGPVAWGLQSAQLSLTPPASAAMLRVTLTGASYAVGPVWSIAGAAVGVKYATLSSIPSSVSWQNLGVEGSVSGTAYGSPRVSGRANIFPRQSLTMGWGMIQQADADLLDYYWTAARGIGRRHGTTLSGGAYPTLILPNHQAAPYMTVGTWGEASPLTRSRFWSSAGVYSAEVSIQEVL